MGKRLISLKGDKPTWSGVSRLNVNDRGQRRFTTMDNVYVSQDGQEIRSFPGYATFLDLTDENNSEGFGRYIPDLIRPILKYSSPNDQFRFSAPYAAASSQSMECRAKLSHAFAFEQIGNEIVLIGESRFREVPLYSSARAKLVVGEVAIDGGGFWVLTLSDSTATISQFDTGAAMNGQVADSPVYFDEITLSSSATEADIALVQNDLVGRVCVATFSASSTVTLAEPASGTLSTGLTPISCVGEIHMVRSNRNNSYPSAPNTPYTSTYDDRPDDPDALTSWKVTEPVQLRDNTKFGRYPCYPAWVANRQRDFGDGTQPTVFAEGLYTDTAGVIRGLSRREQRRLPFRPNVEPALNRIILAAPQYGCMFQIPMMVPIDPSNWRTGVSDGRGISYPNNGIYDKPRALGIPKPRLLESLLTPAAMPSPTDWGTVNQYDSSISTVAGSPDLGLDSGTYQIAISFEDAGTGDEGLASEPITVEVPVNPTYAHTIRINYIHPGYHFPESLCLKMNVYVAPPGSEALAFYGQFELAENPAIHADPQVDISGVYGCAPCTPADDRALFRSFDLPLLDDSGDLSNLLDSTRLAPQSATMPRGATACKFIRGVLFSGGAMGNAGAANQLWSAKATSQWAASSAFFPDDEMNVRAHGLTSATTQSETDGDTENVTLGIAGRAFPDAYQGIEVITDQLFPGGDAIKRVDRVLNRKVQGMFGIETPVFRYHHRERLRLDRGEFNRGRNAGYSPGTNPGYQNVNEPVFYIMPRGQMQISDPGAPNRSSRAFIKLIDPSRGDDIQAIGHLGGSTIACTAKETYSYSWYRNPAGEEPNLMSNEFGCIGTNTMVEFDGGLAWISDRGPVALGSGLQHIGSDLAEDFYGQGSRYVRDTTGMMRHAWGVHDAQRGLVMWGLLRRDSNDAPRSLSIQYEGQTLNVASSGLTDEALSRFPCDEVLIWSYRANAFSHWRPPAGLEVYWMRPLRDADGVVRMCFLAADNRIYALDDDWSDANGVFNAGLGGESALEVTAQASDTNATTIWVNGVICEDGIITTLHRNFALLIRPGTLIEFLDDNGDIVSETTAVSVIGTNQGAEIANIQMSSAQSWTEGQKIRIGGRQRPRLVTSFIGAETLDTMQLQRVQMRYATRGAGSANVRIKGFKSEVEWEGEEARVIPFTQDGKWESLGYPKVGTSIPDEIESMGRRKSFSCGEASGQEIALQIELTGEAQVRLQDVNLEVG